jgi:hypothetical protein
MLWVLLLIKPRAQIDRIHASLQRVRRVAIDSRVFGAQIHDPFPDPTLAGVDEAFVLHGAIFDFVLGEADELKYGGAGRVELLRKLEGTLWKRMVKR